MPAVEDLEDSVRGNDDLVGLMIFGRVGQNLPSVASTVKSVHGSGRIGRRVFRILSDQEDRGRLTEI